MNDQMKNAQESYKAHKYEEALELYNHEILERPENLDAHLGVAKSLFMMKMYTDAISICEKILAHDQTYVAARVIVAESFSNMGETEKGREEIKRAYSMSPTNPLVLASYGMLLFRDEKWEEGIAILENALIHNPDMLDVNFNLAIAYEKQKKYKENTISFKRDISIATNNKKFSAFSVCSYES